KRRPLSGNLKRRTTGTATKFSLAIVSRHDERGLHFFVLIVWRVWSSTRWWCTMPSWSSNKVGQKRVHKSGQVCCDEEGQGRFHRANHAKNHEVFVAKTTARGLFRVDPGQHGQHSDCLHHVTGQFVYSE